jgi:hypothetical protein
MYSYPHIKIARRRFLRDLTSILGSYPLICAGLTHALSQASIPRGSVLTAFSRASGNPTLYRVHLSPNGFELGSGNVLYEGSSPVNAMISHSLGVLTAFRNIGPIGNRIYLSKDGQRLDTGQIVYDGSSPVRAMLSYQGGVLTAFTNAGANGNRIHWSSDGNNLGGGRSRWRLHGAARDAISNN